MAIAMQLQGRLGNVMFQTAFLEYTAHRFGYQTYYPNVKEHIAMLKTDKIYVATPYADDYFKIFKNFNWGINETKEPKIDRLIKEPFQFEFPHTVEDGTKFQGYFQSEEYWGGDRDFMYNLFEPSEIVNRELRRYYHLFNQKTCSIHVRRGDYLKFPDIHPSVTTDYIDRAKLELAPHGISKYLVFSDDIEWCKKNLIGDEYIFIEGEKDYVEMFLMAKCDYRIIANSSFSWWGSYLSKKGGETVAPLNWFGKKDIDSSHICPWYWKKI